MVWDPTKPITNADLLSAPVRDNFAALDAAIVVPLAGAMARALFVKSASGVLVPVGWLVTTGDQMLAPDGAALAPSYSFASHPTGGLYQTGGNLALSAPTGGALVFGVAGALAWFIDGASNLLPGSDGGFDLGNGTFRIRDLWLSRLTNYTAQGSAPATPASGHVVVYVKTDKKLYQKDDAGLETDLTAVGMTNPMSASGDLIVGGASGTPTRLAKAADGTFLKLASGTPAWATVTISPPPIPLPIEQANLPDATGTGNNPPEIVREVSTGTQTTNTPKRTRTFAKFDAATDEHLTWGRSMPSDYVSGGTIRLKWKAATATSGNVIWKAGIQFTTDGSTADSAAVFNAADLSAAVAAPGTLGQTVEFTIALTMTGALANREFTVFIGRDADHASDTMAGDAVLMSARLEYA